MFEHEKQAQFVRGVLRRTKSDVPPEWGPGAVPRIFILLAVYAHALAACWVLFFLRFLLSGTAPELWTALIILFVYAFSLLFGYIGRRVLVFRIPFAYLVWVVAFGLLAYSFGEYAFSPDAPSPEWMFVLAAVFFLVGFGPVLRAVFVARGQRKRGYDDSAERGLTRGVLLLEVLALALGVYSAFSWCDLIGF